MVNATEMRKVFPNRRMNDFLRLKQTQEFIELLEAQDGNSRLGAKHVSSGKIKELLLTGKTEFNPKAEAIDIKTLEFVFQKIKDNAMEIHYLSDVIEDLKKTKDKNS